MPNDGNQRPAGLKFLDRLVGTWTMSGDTQGQITYEWMDGGFFLIARGDINQQGRRMKHIEIIGFDHPVEADGPASTLTSRLYTSTGNTLDYTHEIDDEGVASWYGAKGARHHMKARWSPDGNSLSGGWEWPGGGYSFVLTRT